MKEYFIIIGEEKTGPFTLMDLKEQNITGETMVWTKGMKEWTKIKETKELIGLLESIPPPLPNTSKTKIENKKESFSEYLYKNKLLLIISIIISLVFGYYVHESYYQIRLFMYPNIDFSALDLERESYYNSKVYPVRDTIKIIGWFLGIFSVPLYYFFKKK